MKIDVTGLDKYERDVRDVISDLVDDEDVVSQETKTFVDGTQRYMDRFAKQVRDAVSRIDDWNGAHVETAPFYTTRKKDRGSSFPWADWESVTGDDEDRGVRQATVTVYLGARRRESPMFTIFGDKTVDDVLDSGDPDFFGDPREESDYFALVGELRDPGSSRKTEMLTLWTVRPKRDRTRYAHARDIPSGIFLTSNQDDAAALARDLPDSSRDLWRVRVSSKYVVRTNDTGRLQHYQAVSPGKTIPVEDLTLVAELDEEKIVDKLRLSALVAQRVSKLLKHEGPWAVEKSLWDAQNYHATLISRDDKNAPEDPNTNRLVFTMGGHDYDEDGDPTAWWAKLTPDRKSRLHGRMPNYRGDGEDLRTAIEDLSPVPARQYAGSVRESLDYLASLL